MLKCLWILIFHNLLDNLTDVSCPNLLRLKNWLKNKYYSRNLYIYIYRWYKLYFYKLYKGLEQISGTGPKISCGGSTHEYCLPLQGYKVHLNWRSDNNIWGQYAYMYIDTIHPITKVYTYTSTKWFTYDLSVWHIRSTVKIDLPDLI